MKQVSFSIIAILLMASCRSNEPAVETIQDTLYNEPHRLQVHFSPPEKWMNDPNGMVYYNKEYHLFYQHYPDSTVWGPMHWGHAMSTDLVRWTHLPIALYPDSLGMIFSGSAVVDINNTSGLGSENAPAIVAFYTYHNMDGEKSGRADYQSQGMAFSTDGARTWTKSPKNPVIPNPGARDFRDPKVVWHEDTRRWIMALAVGDHVELYGSPNLIDWRKLSEFGKGHGAHGGVWECPELVRIPVEGGQESRWVMLVSINPGGPNGGSATQYFVGDFDGTTFTTAQRSADSLWVDFGPDNYAGVTWYNAPDNRRIFSAWLNNWAYAQVVPTGKWRGALTLPRDLSLVKAGTQYLLRSRLSKEVNALAGRSQEFTVTGDTMDLAAPGFSASVSLIEGMVDAGDFEIMLSNSGGQRLLIGLDASRNRFYVDRSHSGNTGFSPNFFPRSEAPRFATGPVKFTVVADVSAVEVFFDDGLSVMTSLFFPDEPFTNVKLYSKNGGMRVNNLKLTELTSVWK